MGRIQTPQINFSLIDTNYTQKELALKIRVKFGIIGHLTLLEVLLWINAGKGCYAEYSESTPATFAMTRLGSLEHAEEVKAIFMYMLEIGFFDLDAFREDKILTSEGIVRRWMAAKRRPEIYDFPAAVKGIIARIKKEETPDGNGAESGPETDGSGPDYGPAPRNAGNGPVSGNNANIPQTAPLSAQTAHLCTENAHLSRQGEERRGEEYINKQKNKQTKRAKDAPEDAGGVGNTPTEPETGPETGTPPGSAEPASLAETVRTARANPRWCEIRARIARIVYEPGLSADLTDWIAAAAVLKWIHVPQADAWKRKAREEIEVARRTDQRRGKLRAWETFRPWIESVYLAHGIVLPPCSPKNREPPPPPEIPPGLDVPAEEAARLAGRNVMPK